MKGVYWDLWEQRERGREKQRGSREPARPVSEPLPGAGRRRVLRLPLLLGVFRKLGSLIILGSL